MPNLNADWEAAAPVAAPAALASEWEAATPHETDMGDWTPAAPSTPESALPYMADKFKQGVAGLATLAGAPVDLIGAGLDRAEALRQGFVGTAKALVTGKPTPPRKPQPRPERVGGMAQVGRGWEELLGVQKIKAPLTPWGEESKSNEYLGKIAEFSGGMLFPGAGVVAKAQQKVATAVTLALGTTASATGAVEGKSLGAKIGPTFGLSPEEGAAVGEVAGGFTGPALVGKVAQGLVSTFNHSAATLEKVGVTGMSKDAQRAAASGLLNKEIANALQAAPMSEANVARALRLKQKAENFSPNIAQMTDSPGLIATYREVANKSPQALAKAAEAERRNLAAIAEYKNKVFLKVGEGDMAADLTRPAKIKLAADREVLGMELGRTQRELDFLSSQFRRSVDNEAVGNELRAMYWANREVAKAGVNRLYEGPNGVYQTARKFNVRDDMTDMREAVHKIVGADRTTFQNMPPTFAKILQEYPAGTPDTVLRKPVMMPGAAAPIYKTTVVKGQPGKSEASFEEMHSLYKQANKDYADAVIAGDPTKAHYMKMIREQLQGKVDKYNNPQYGELAQKFGEANRAHAQYSHVFREGAGGELAKRTRSGISTDAEDIVRKTFLQVGDKKKGVQEFFELYGNDKRAAELLHDGLLDNYAKAAMKDGVFDPKAAQRWLDGHHSALGELPETRKILGDAQKSAAAMVDRRLELQAQRKVLDRSVLAKVAGNEQPEKLIQRAIDDPKLMRGLLEGAYTKESKDAIARSVADVVLQKADAYGFLEKNARTLKPVMEQLGKGHWDNLMDIAEMEKISARTKAPTQVELSKLQDIGEQTIGTSVKGMFSRLRNLDKPMGVSKEYLIMDVGGRFFYKVRSEELAKLRETAMFDPNVAEVLARLGQKHKYTARELLDLQAISYAAGANSTAQAVGAERRREGGPLQAGE